MKVYICVDMELVAADFPGLRQIVGRTLAHTGADVLEVERIARLILNVSRGPSWI